VSAGRGPGEAGGLRVALLGNPNTGKTTLFNRLTGLRHKTSNFPGTTLEAREGALNLGGAEGRLIDLPGVYSLNLDLLESRVTREALQGPAAPEAVLIVADATNLARNLRLAGEALRLRLPTVLALNMVDLADRQGLRINTAELSARLGCAVVPICARAGTGLTELRAALAGAVVPNRTPPGDDAGLTDWADACVVACASGGEDLSRQTLTDRLDRAFTHPVLGAGAFVLIGAAMFYAIFSLASLPMDLIDGFFGRLADMVGAVLPEGLLKDFLTGGVIAGVGATLVFLPQICLLFFMISLLEDTGYLARAAFVMDRLLRPFGLPGHAFVPLLSSHACALPGIMAARAIPDPRERLATILCAPFMTCSARLPVYVLLTGMLFPAKPLLAALAFVGCYALGIAAGVLSALIARRTILRGRSRPMALELPSYKRPSLRTAFMTTLDRAVVFLRKAGTGILAISIVLWWLGTFPHITPTPPRAEELRAMAQRDETAGLVEQARAHAEEAQAIESAHRRAHKRDSYLGRLGQSVQPALAPLGYDWQISIGVLASFAAREVFVGTMAVVATGQEEQDEQGLVEQLRYAKRDDGKTPLFDAPTVWSLLVFYVLAMQCLPTLVVTARESGHAKWALLQLAWMSSVAFTAALAARHIALALGAGGALGG
jgi:ferrous iron transport protein B